MSKQSCVTITVLSLLAAGLVFLGCDPSESTDVGVAPFNKTVKAQAAQAGEPAPVLEMDRSKAQSAFITATKVALADRYVVFDFGLKALLHDGDPKVAKASVRTYLNCYTAKRMQVALAMSVERHAEVFGALEQDKPMPMAALPEVALRPNYANFVRITGTPEELIVDMGLNPRPIGVPTAPIPISHIVIMDFQTANTLLGQVGIVLDEYEKEHGPIETDIQKRITGR